jgi:hypothetical protein
MHYTLNKRPPYSFYVAVWALIYYDHKHCRVENSTVWMSLVGSLVQYFAIF